MEIYESQARSLLRRLSARDRSQWPLHRVQTAINDVATQFPSVQLEGRLGVLLNDIRAAAALKDIVTVVGGGPPRKKRQKGPRMTAKTIPYLAGVFLRKRYGNNWTGKLTEEDWQEFAKERGYDPSRLNQARAQLTAIYHGIRGYVDGPEPQGD